MQFWLCSLYSSDRALVCKCYFFGGTWILFSLCGDIGKDLSLRTFFFLFLHAASYAVGLLKT